MGSVDCQFGVVFMSRFSWYKCSLNGGCNISRPRVRSVTGDVDCVFGLRLQRLDKGREWRFRCDGGANMVDIVAPADAPNGDDEPGVQDPINSLC